MGNLGNSLIPLLGPLRPSSKVEEAAAGTQPPVAGLRAIRRYRLLSAAERTRTLDHEDELLAAAQRAVRTGWRSHERDVICAEAKHLGVLLWPALIDRLVREARATTARR